LRRYHSELVIARVHRVIYGRGPEEAAREFTFHPKIVGVSEEFLAIVVLLICNPESTLVSGS
jgi:hypothetical protein